MNSSRIEENLYQERLEILKIKNEIIEFMTKKNSKNSKSSKKEKPSGTGGGKKERSSVSRKIRNEKDSKSEK